MKLNQLLALIALAVCGVLSSSAQTWTQTSAPINSWSCIACSADGTKLFAGAGGGLLQGNSAPIYISTNSGSSWLATTSPTNEWVSIACSADGTKVVAATFTTSGGIYTSSDSGFTWVSNNVPSQQYPWNCVASSTDGSKLFAVTTMGQLYKTINAGALWISNGTPNRAAAIACSSDGVKLLAAPGDAGDHGTSGYLCTSPDAGATWQTNGPFSRRYWASVASSPDGKIIGAVDGNGSSIGHVYTSTNYGGNWMTNNVPQWSWQNIALSADGTKMIVAGWGGSGSPFGPIYTSTDSGQTWTSNNIPIMTWQGVACSADGNEMMAVSEGTYNNVGNGGIWILQTTPSPSLGFSLTDSLQLSWLIPSTNFVLQQSSDLVNWSVVTNAPVLNLTNLQNQVALPLSDGNAFFRLATP
jgi:hypothetical protein